MIYAYMHVQNELAQVLISKQIGMSGFSCSFGPVFVNWFHFSVSAQALVNVGLSLIDLDKQEKNKT